MQMNFKLLSEFLNWEDSQWLNAIQATNFLWFLCNFLDYTQDFQSKV